MLSLIGDETLPDAAATGAQPATTTATAPAASATPPALEVDLLGGFYEGDETATATAAIPAEDLIGAPRPSLT